MNYFFKKTNNNLIKNTMSQNNIVNKILRKKNNASIKELKILQKRLNNINTKISNHDRLQKSNNNLINNIVNKKKLFGLIPRRKKIKTTKLKLINEKKIIKNKISKTFKNNNNNNKNNFNLSFIENNEINKELQKYQEEIIDEFRKDSNKYVNIDPELTKNYIITQFNNHNFIYQDKEDFMFLV